MKTEVLNSEFISKTVCEKSKDYARAVMSEFVEDICMRLDTAIQVHEQLCLINQNYHDEFRRLTPRQLSPGKILDGLLSDDAETIEKALTDFRAIMLVI